jgi:hypothetical protein
MRKSVLAACVLAALVAAGCSEGHEHNDPRLRTNTTQVGVESQGDRLGCAGDEDPVLHGDVWHCHHPDGGMRVAPDQP